MKKIIVFLLLASAALSACGTVQQPQTEFVPAEENCLRVCTTLDKAVWEPFLLEFQEQSEIWVYMEQLSGEELLDRMEKEPDSVDLILGCAPDTVGSLEALLCPLPLEGMGDRLWTTAFYRTPVIIYNPDLIRKNPPRGFSDFTDSRWQGSFALADPNTDDMSRYIMSGLCTLYPEREKEAVLRDFLRNTGGVFQSEREVLDAVLAGSCPMGIVQESEALNAVSRGEQIAIVYPEEGAPLCPAAMALPKESGHPEQAAGLMKFILDEKTQRHGWEFHNLRPVLEGEEYLPPAAVYYEEGTELRSELLSVWNEMRKGEL